MNKVGSEWQELDLGVGKIPNLPRLVPHEEDELAPPLPMSKFHSADNTKSHSD
jgi:hypothetical protein